MDADELAEVAREDLEPMLAARAEFVAARKRRKRGGRSAPGNEMWVSVPDGPEVRLTRSLPLSRWEADILEPYGNALADLHNVPDAIARTAATEVALRAIAAQLGGESAHVVESAMRFLLRSAASTYEGQALHLNILLDLQSSPTTDPPISLNRLDAQPWHALLGSGLDTGIVVDRNGNVVRVEDVRTMEPPTLLHPDVFRHMAAWADSPHRIALSLSRSREIVIHQSGQLRYIYRSGRWHGLPFAVALSTGWSTGSSTKKALKSDILASVIDASLGHHGACLAVVVPGRRNAFLGSPPIQASDMWPTDTRSRLFATAQFRSLTRRQRLELLSMDGATILSASGRILAAGAIVRVPAGSPAGGRLAATRALAEFGAAFKVSQDGPVALFGIGPTGVVEQKLALS